MRGLGGLSCKGRPAPAFWASCVCVFARPAGRAPFQFDNHRSNLQETAESSPCYFIHEEKFSTFRTSESACKKEASGKTFYLFNFSLNFVCLATATLASTAAIRPTASAIALVATVFQKEASAVECGSHCLQRSSDRGEGNCSEREVSSRSCNPGRCHLCARVR